MMAASLWSSCVFRARLSAFLTSLLPLDVSAKPGNTADRATSSMATRAKHTAFADWFELLCARRDVSKPGVVGLMLPLSRPFGARSSTSIMSVLAAETGRVSSDCLVRLLRRRCGRASHPDKSGCVAPRRSHRVRNGSANNNCTLGSGGEDGSSAEPKLVMSAASRPLAMGW